MRTSCFHRTFFCFLILNLATTNALLSQKGKNNSPNNDIIISGHFTSTNYPDTVTILVWKDIDVLKKKLVLPHREIKSFVKNGFFKTTIQTQTKISFVSLGWNYRNGALVEFIPSYPTESGSSINIEIKDPNKELDTENVLFGGKGASSYNCKLQLDNTFQAINQQWLDGKADPSLPTWSEAKWRNPNGAAKDEYYFDYLEHVTNSQNIWDQALKEQLGILRTYRNKIRRSFYDLMKVEIISNAEYQKEYFDMETAIKRLAKTASSEWIKEKKKVEGYLNSSDSLQKIIPQEIILKSPAYTIFKWKRFAIQRDLGSFTSVHEGIKSKLKGRFRDKMLWVDILLDGFHWDSITREKNEDDSYRLMADNQYRLLLKDYMSNTKRGNFAYDFSLLDKNERLIHLHDFKGKIVFMDFWFVGCGGCSQYYNNVVSKVEEHFRNDSNVVFVSICETPEKSLWLKGVSSNEYTSEYAVNIHSTIGFSDPLFKRFKVDSYPHPLLIGKDQRIISDSEKELRANGVQGLITMIDTAITGNKIQSD